MFARRRVRVAQAWHHNLLVNIIVIIESAGPAHAQARGPGWCGCPDSIKSGTASGPGVRTPRFKSGTASGPGVRTPRFKSGTASGPAPSGLNLRADRHARPPPCPARAGTARDPAQSESAAALRLSALPGPPRQQAAAGVRLGQRRPSAGLASKPTELPSGHLPLCALKPIIGPLEARPRAGAPASDRNTHARASLARADFSGQCDPPASAST
jgi:hypothetical protein